MKIRTNDKVKIIAGKDKGKTGKVLRVYRDGQKVMVEGINIVKKHVKPGGANKEGGIVSIEKPVNISNVMFVDPKTNEPTKLGYKVIEGKKYRLNRKTGDVIDA